MSLRFFYLAFVCIETFHRFANGDVDKFREHAKFIRTSCVTNHCGSRDEHGVVTICEDEELSLHCPVLNDESDSASLTSENVKADNNTSNHYRTFCEEEHGEVPCQDSLITTTKSLPRNVQENVHRENVQENVQENVHRENVHQENVQENVHQENVQENVHRENVHQENVQGNVHQENVRENVHQENVRENVHQENVQENVHQEREVSDSISNSSSNEESADFQEIITNSFHPTIDDSSVNHLDSRSSSSSSKEVSDFLLSHLQDVIFSTERIRWPEMNKFKTVDDTFYRIRISEHCSDAEKRKKAQAMLIMSAHHSQQTQSLTAERSYNSRKRVKRLHPAKNARNGHNKMRRYRETNHNSHTSGEGHHGHIGTQEKASLEDIYGHKTYSQHEQDFQHVADMGQDDHGSVEHKLHVNNPSNANMDDIADEARLNAVNNEFMSNEGDEFAVNNLNSNAVKGMLKELLEKLETMEHDTSHKKTMSHGHCDLHGLWLSSVAGVAIELIPEKQEGVVHTKIVDLPQPPDGALLNGNWGGQGMISRESPTTLTIVFQEHVHHDNDISAAPPRTAIFVGQCLVCEGSPMLQGTWILFPNSQSCVPSDNAHSEPTSDIMTLVRR